MKPKPLIRSAFICAAVLVPWLVPAADRQEDGLFRARSVGQDLVILDWHGPAVREAARQAGPIVVERFPLHAGLEVDLELEPFSVTGPDTRFVIGQRNGPDRPLDFDAERISLFHGKVSGRAGSHVMLALSEGRSTGWIDLGPGAARHLVASRGEQGEQLGPHGLSVFQPSGPAALPPDVPLCGVTDEPAGNPPPPPGPVPTITGSTRGLLHMELAVETDYEFFVLFDDAIDASTYLVEMYAQLSAIYMRDVDTRVELVFARLWDDPDDLFNIVDPSPLPEFRSYWNANMGSVDRDVAMLLSGRRDYPFGGQAYLSTLCGSSAYSVVGYAMGFFPDPSRPSPYHYDISVTAHELGHNSGTGHTHGSPDFIDTCHDPLTTPQRGTIMSYCGQTWSGGNANRDLYFHSAIQLHMDSHINSVSCIVDDCNQNGIADSIDVQGASADTDGNGIPDECEDCNGNMVLDDADIANATSLDLNGNSIPDDCEPDCNGNSVPDDKDIADATSTDVHGNDIPDECETDCDSDGTSDYSEIQLDMPLDVDRGADLDVCQDCDTDGTSDFEELAGAHHVWVASGLETSEVREFYTTTGVLTRTSSGGTVDEGQDLIVTGDGRVLVTSGADQRVMEFDSTGSYVGDLVAAGAGGLVTPTGLIMTPAGRLFVSSAGTDSVLAYDGATGAFQETFVAGGSGGLTAPFGLTLGRNGHLFVTSSTNEVLEYDGFTGAFLGAFVPAGDNGGLDQPRGLAFKPDGNLLVASFGTNETLEYEGTSGDPLGKWAQVGTATRLTQVSPWGVRVGPNGNVYIVRTGEAYGSPASEEGEHDHDDIFDDILDVEDLGSNIQALHLSNAQIYEFDVRNGNFLRTYIGGNDHGMLFPTGFDFAPGWALDCNLSLLPDDCDITLGISQDIDFSGVPDECEIDCNGNGKLDRLDVVPYGAALDCNYNQKPDDCDISGGTSHDCNLNGVPDECDVTDDFESDQGWIAGALGDDATTGIWVRVDPNGTGAQAEDDHTPTPGALAFVTGQGPPGGADGDADVDGGKTTLLSPVLDLSDDPDADIGYWRWFSNDAGSNPNEDVFVVDVSDDGGGSWTNVETVGPDGPETTGGWFFHSFRVSDFVMPNDSVRLRFVAEDAGGGSIVEAAVDDLAIVAECAPCTADVQCDDGRSCTTDTCNLVDGSCENTLDAGFCMIDGICRAPGDPNPLNDCEACDSVAPTAWSASPPSEVQDLILERRSFTRLNWTAQGSTTRYDVASGDLSTLRSAGNTNDAVCVENDFPSSRWDDTRPDPLSGEGYYYMLRSQKSCGVGPYGAGTSGAPWEPTADCP